MLEFRRKTKPTQVNNDVSAQAKPTLRRMRKRIGLQACIAVLTIVLTVVIAFGVTAAWYTNVVQSGGLIFEVEKFGVNVDATLSGNTFKAQPGDEGVIGLEAKNSESGIVRVRVSVGKSGMDEMMRKRLYFFVDAQSLRSGETMQRTYLTETDDYAYTLFAGNSLTLTQERHNAAQLKWCWVYDVLGYYVRGQADASGNVAVAEYLRPIEYDYDRATFGADGKLLTVDGTTTAEAFLTELSEADGYPGTIDLSKKTEANYHPVSVDANGYGVYAYLCTYDEVEQNTRYDTQLGSGENTDTYTARLTVTAEQAEYAVREVADAEDFAAMMADESVQMVRLTQDVTLDDEVAVSAGREVLIDLNGKTLTTDHPWDAFNLEPTASLSIMNGTMAGDTVQNAFRIQGSQLTLDHVNFSDYGIGICIWDEDGEGKNSVVRLTDCNITTTGYTIRINGNGTLSEQTTQLYIDGCTLTGDSYVITGNGSPEYNGTDIQIANSTLTVTEGLIYAAIYHPQSDSTLNIYNSDITAYTGVAIKGGAVTITDSRITGRGTVSQTPALGGNGYSDTADAVYVETSYKYDISLTVRNCTLTSTAGKALRVFEENSPYVTLIDEGNTKVEPT